MGFRLDRIILLETGKRTQVGRGLSEQAFRFRNFGVGALVRLSLSFL